MSIFSFILHLSCIIFYPCSYLLFFPSFLLIHLSICDKKRESIPVCFVISIWLMCTFLGGEILPRVHFLGEKAIAEMHIPRRRKYFFRKPCFTLCLFSRCFMVLWVMFSIIYALLLSSHHSYVLDMHISLCHCALLIACSDDHLLCYVIIVLISIWLFDVWSSCSYVLQHVYLITCLLVTLYLSFYH